MGRRVRGERWRRNEIREFPGSANAISRYSSEVSHNDSRSLDVKLASTCKKPMACAVDWTITCGKTSNVTHNAAVLAESAEHAWVASAATCKEDWSISTTWRCDPK